MAAHEPGYKNLPDSDDEDQPIVFKRSSNASKPLNKPLSQKSLKPPPKPSSDLSSPIEKKSTISSSNSLPGRRNSQATNKKTASDTPLKVLPSNGLSKPNGGSPDSDDSDDDKPLSFRISQGSKTSSKPCTEARKSGNSVENKPLSFRGASSSSERQKTSHVNVKTVQTPSEVKDESNDSEDEKPLVSRFKAKPKQMKDDSDEEKPLASRFKQNGSNKRPLSNASKPSPSSNKKVKPLENSVTKVKHEVSVKEEVKTEGSGDDDDDYIPISQRTKKLAPKQTPTKKTVTKVKPMSVKDGKVKKTTQNTKVSKSFKLPPGSGEGQKWTTLEHCGVIFPPPYKPHGVKMLYNGKPVDLTPEQEEVGLNLILSFYSAFHCLWIFS